MQVNNQGDLVPSTQPLAVCLSEFRKQRQDANHLIAKFCESSPDTVRRWPKLLPQGGALLRLQYFLKTVGFEPDVPTSSHPTAQYLGKLVAFRVISAQDAMDLMNLKGVNDSYFWRVIRGDITPTILRSNGLPPKVLEDMYAEELAAKYKELTPTVIPTSTSPPPTRQRVRGPVHPPASPQDQTANTMLVVLTSSNLLSCLPLLRELAAQNDPDVGAQLRQLMGRENFHDLLDLLKGMSSREAGKFFQSKSRDSS